MPERFLVSLLPAGTPDPKAKGTLVIIHHKTQDNRQGSVILPRKNAVANKKSDMHDISSTV